MKRNRVSREMIYGLVLNTLKNFVVTYYSNRWPKGFRIWLGRKKRIEEKAEEITNLIRKRRASQSKRKIINLMDGSITKFYYEYKTNVKTKKE